MKKQIILVALALLLSGCAKTAEAVPTTSSNTGSYIEQHLESDSKNLYDYARYVEIDDKYYDAYKDYLCFRSGSYPVCAKLSDESIESKNRIWIGNGYTMKIEFADDNIYEWTWNDDECRNAVIEALDNGKAVYESVLAEDESLYAKYKDEIFTDDFFRDVMKTESATFDYYPPYPSEQNFENKLSKSEIRKIKEILHTATIDKTQDSSKSTKTYTLSLYDRHGNYVFVIAMDDDKKTIYVEDGLVESKELNDFMNSLIKSEWKTN